ncbi:G-protein coupled receptor Mth2 [Orchesella cincta]|uniref:G-protein coupled receptor Mth2 n=1 Tax=Orchesella cincta TaxID=48709 RepID=A0A1D2N5Q5_ORCCI|nr:G-protein coupled receptor Mth2 [Orchesella cincta]
MERRKITIALKILIFGTLLKSSHCEQITLYGCPCASGECETEHQSEFWTSFNYEPEQNVTKEYRVRINDTHWPCDSIPSEKILINMGDPYNAYGYHGQLHGTLENGDTANVEINEVGVLSLFADHLNGGEQISKESYCVRRLNVSHTSIEICCGKEKSCIRKCCPYGFSFSYNMSNPCVLASTAGWRVPIHGSNHFAMNENGMKIRTGFPSCEIFPYNITQVLSTSLTKLNTPRRSFLLSDDGELKILGGRSTWKTIPEEVSYCVDTLALPHDQTDMTCGADEQDVLILCAKAHIKEIPKDDWIYRVVYMTGFVIAIIVLTATAVIHFLLWEKQNIHAWTILCYVITLTFFYACLLTIYIEETRKRVSVHYVPFFSKCWCFSLGVITHFMGIFSFAWLSIINFDLWWTFRILKPMNQRNLDVKRLFLYASFALAVPTLVVSIAAVLQLNHSKQSEPCRKTAEDHTIYPSYGEDGCFLANSSQPYYFYLPVGILLLANLIFYLCTSCQMLRIYNATRRISDRNQRKQKQSCELFLKLFLVMGTTWIFQVILSIVENDERKWYSPFFAVLDMVNMFQAIAIFVIFVCKRETLRALEQKYFCLKSCLHPLRGVYRTPTVISRSTDGGSTKISRTEFTKGNPESSSGGDHRRDSELISFS